MKKIAIFASGEGTNAQRLIDYCKGSEIKIMLIVCNNPTANVLNRARKNNIPSLLIDKEMFNNGDSVLKKLQDSKIDLIVLAGFLWKIPNNILRSFPNKIINIHPALLPKFGGKGMYGINVHQAVVEAGEKQSGITIHYVNENYDEGEMILQKKCDVAKEDTAEMLAQKVLQLEHEWYPKTIELILKS
ncbi:MAG: phosphoribosylglycinamide formyltransferase [Bacteroidetes bacterium]|nr:phosphoribosylglycinamide formyltransferase [Bacteroidota bacterium]